jgi:superfamily II DNA or RNA helicase
MDEIQAHKKNEVYVKLQCDRGTAMELSDFFTFEVPGAKFMPAVRNKVWDGKIRLYNVNTQLIYSGLIKHIEYFCEERGYNLVVNDGITDTIDIPVNGLAKYLNDGEFTLREYQLRAVAHAIRNHRALILSPTASGKSFIIYCLLRFYLRTAKKKALVVVPTTSLVYQMNSDFIDYSKNLQFYYTHCIVGGQAKNDDDAKIYISTWQSIYKQPKKWFDQFDIVIGDEAHLFKANSLTKIMEKLTDCRYRFGFTGSLDGTQTNRLVLEGLFGPVMKVVDTKELIENKTLSDFRIKCLTLKYEDSICKLMKKAKYQDEMDYLVTNVSRNNFIKNLTLTRKGNTLLLYQYVEKHGRVLYDIIKGEVDKERKVFFIYGGVDAEIREEIRNITETQQDAIIVASYGTFSTGINIRNLHNVIFSSPSKSRVRTLQSIGRALRKGDNKDIATLYDISDDLSHKSHVNHTLKHFAERVKMYNDEQFEYKLYNIRLNSID